MHFEAEKMNLHEGERPSECPSKHFSPGNQTPADRDVRPGVASSFNDFLGGTQKLELVKPRPPQV